MTIYNEMKDCHIALATGDDAGGGSGLTAWRNADQPFIQGELIPSDIMLGWTNTLPSYETKTIGSMTSSRVKKRFSTRRKSGIWKSKHALQTAQFCFWLMQTTGTPTTEGTPVGYNTHTLTIGATNVPDWHGIHFEREGIAANELRYDLMGFLPSDLVIECGEASDVYKATQEITVPYTYANKSSGNLTPQTPRDTGAIGSLWKDWSHLIDSNGGGDAPSGLTYNAAQLEVDVKNVRIKLNRNYYFGTPDTTGFPTIGLILDWNYSVELDVVPIGDLLYTVNDTKKESYNDLDYNFKFEANATNDYIQFNFDKMYMIPFDETNDWDKILEGYHITLEPLDTTSSLTTTGIDNLNNNHYENP